MTVEELIEQLRQHPPDMSVEVEDFGPDDDALDDNPVVKRGRITSDADVRDVVTITSQALFVRWVDHAFPMLAGGGA